MTNPEWADLSCRLCWSLGGFLLGYLVGRGARDIHEMKEAIVTDNATPAVKRDYLAFLSVVQTRGFGAILIILAVLTVGVSGYTLNKQGKLLDCQTRFNTAYSDALAERTIAAGQDRKATRDMVATIAGIDSVPDNERRQMYRAALIAFLDASKDADQRRADNPLPSPRCP